MKTIFSLIIILSIIITGCNDSSGHIGQKSDIKSDNPPAKNISISDDTLMQGDIFMTSGPAGKMDQKQGKIVLIGNSGEAMPVILKNNKLMAVGLNDNILFEIKKSGDQVSYFTSDSTAASGKGNLVLLTDSNEMLDVKLIGDRLVVLTKNNIMIPLVKE